MRWLLLPFRFCLYFPFYALFGSLRWLTHDFDRFVNIGAKLIGFTFVLWFLALASGVTFYFTLPPEMPFWWWVVILILLWCALGWLLSTRPFQWVFGRIADYSKAAILPAKKVATPVAAPPPLVEEPVAQEYYATVATEGIAKRVTVQDAKRALSPALRNLINAR